MSKSKSSRGRVTSSNANVRRPVVYTKQPTLPLALPRVPLKLIEIEDRRTFHPDEHRTARTFRNAGHLLDARTPTPQMLARHPNRVAQGLAFQAPRELLVCHRRKTRREVIHALNKAGKVGQKRPRRSFFSDISCKG